MGTPTSFFPFFNPISLGSSHVPSPQRLDPGREDPSPTVVPSSTVKVLLPATPTKIYTDVSTSDLGHDHSGRRTGLPSRCTHRDGSVLRLSFPVQGKDVRTEVRRRSRETTTLVCASVVRFIFKLSVSRSNPWGLVAPKVLPLVSTYWSDIELETKAQ